MRIIRCPHCGQVIEIGSTRQSGEKVAGRYLPGTKGAFIFECIQQSGTQGISRADLQRKLFEKYGNDSVGRLNRVLYELTSDGVIVNADGVYKLADAQKKARKQNK